MKKLDGALLCVLMIAGAVVYAHRIDGAAVDIVSETGSIATSSPAAPELFRVLLSGVDVGCTLAHSAGSEAPLEVGKGCAHSLPALADAKRWRQEPDGSVALADGGGHALLRLAVADGADWESYEPATPIVSLIAER